VLACFFLHLSGDSEWETMPVLTVSLHLSRSRTAIKRDDGTSWH
jgi:hypothetical protein